jgi:hypothetical protein
MEDSTFYMRILRNRRNLKFLSKYEILSIAEVDRVLARMGNGSSMEDALYAMKKDREREKGSHE